MIKMMKTIEEMEKELLEVEAMLNKPNENDVLVKLLNDKEIRSKESERTKKWLHDYKYLSDTVELQHDDKKAQKMYKEMFRLRSLIVKYSKYAKQVLN